MTLPVAITPGDPGHISDHEESHQLLSRLDGQEDFLATGVFQDLLANRPPAADSLGLIFHATDVPASFYSDGSVWSRWIRTDDSNSFTAINNFADDTFFGSGRPWADVMHEDHGAAGDGVTPDDAAVQSAIDAVVALGGGIVYFPISGGGYLIDTTSLSIPVGGTPLTLMGAGHAESTSRGSVILHRHADPLFAPSGAGSINFLTLKHLFIDTDSDSGWLFDTSAGNHTYNFLEFFDVTVNLANPAAGIMTHVGSFVHATFKKLRALHDVDNVSAPMFDVTAGPGANFFAVLFEDFFPRQETSGTATATSPMVIFDAGSGDAGTPNGGVSVGPTFRRVTIERPGGGFARVLSSRHVEFDQCFSADLNTDPNNPTVDIRKSDSHTVQPFQVTYKDCELIEGASAAPDIKHEDVSGMAPPVLINTRASFVEAERNGPIAIGQENIGTLVGSTRIVRHTDEVTGIDRLLGEVSSDDLFAGFDVASATTTHVPHLRTRKAAGTLGAEADISGTHDLAKWSAWGWMNGAYREAGELLWEPVSPSGSVVPGRLTAKLTDSGGTLQDVLRLQDDRIQALGGAKFMTIASDADQAAIQALAGTDPTNPADGDIWYDGTDFKIRKGATTHTFNTTAV